MVGKKKRIFSGVKSEGNEFKQGIKKEGAEGFVAECVAELEACGTATLFRRTISDVQEPFSIKCVLHREYLQSIFAVSTACLADLSCPCLGTEKKERKKNYKYLYIFSQEVWFYDVMPMG
jgi:hypothetical protein